MKIRMFVLISFFLVTVLLSYQWNITEAYRETSTWTALQSKSENLTTHNGSLLDVSSLNLPLVVKEYPSFGPVEPTPTSTSATGTLEPSTTPTLTSTPTPTLTPTPWRPNAGRWEWYVTSNLYVFFDVSSEGDSITSATIKDYVGQCGISSYTFYLPHPIPIENYNFNYTVYNLDMTLNTQFKGKFTSYYQAEGSYYLSGTEYVGYVPCKWSVSNNWYAHSKTPTPTATPIPTRTPRPTLTPSTPGTPTPTRTPRPGTPMPWVTILSTDFEGDFPAPWKVYDFDDETNGEYYWGKRNCRAYEGSYSGWAVGAGADGAALSCGSNYPNNADSNMVYGPFSLEDASAAELRFKLWTNTEWDYDELLVCASPVFFDYFPLWDCTRGEWTGTSTGWIDVVVDLESDFSYFDLLGQPEVWVMLNFISNQSTTYPEGIYVDNIVLRKCPLGGSCQ